MAHAPCQLLLWGTAVRSPLLLLLATVLLGGCAAPPASGSTTPSGGTPALTAIVTSSDLAVGLNHLGIALVNDDHPSRTARCN